MAYLSAEYVKNLTLRRKTKAGPSPRPPRRPRNIRLTVETHDLWSDIVLLKPDFNVRKHKIMFWEDLIEREYIAITNGSAARRSETNPTIWYRPKYGEANRMWHFNISLESFDKLGKICEFYKISIREWVETTIRAQHMLMTLKSR